MYEKICESLNKQAMKIINFQKKQMKLLTNEKKKFYKSGKPVIFVKNSLKINISQIKSIIKLEIIVIKWVNTEVLDIVYVI